MLCCIVISQLTISSLIVVNSLENEISTFFLLKSDIRLSKAPLLFPIAPENLVLFGFASVCPPLCHPINPELMLLIPSSKILSKILLTSSTVVTSTSCVENTPFLESDIRKSILIGIFPSAVFQLMFHCQLNAVCMP